LIAIVVIALACYGLAPLAGTFFSHNVWRVFRHRFNELRSYPVLNYSVLQRAGDGIFRFTGYLESITDDHIMWVRGENITVPVDLTGASTYLFPLSGDKGDPQRVRWDKVMALIEGTRVFIGGRLATQQNRRIFVAGTDGPLIIIFYEGTDRSLNNRVLWAGRHSNEYFNTLTPYALAVGVFAQLSIAISFLHRPAFRLTAVVAFIAMFLPLFPVLPPGILFTALYIRLWHRARMFRAYRDTVRILIRQANRFLPDGEYYCSVQTDEVADQSLLLVPTGAKVHTYTLFGVTGTDGALPAEPQDFAALYGFVPGNPHELERQYTVRAHFWEVAAWILLIAGIVLNGYFVVLILSILP
jgi:hypothetical protein